MCGIAGFTHLRCSAAPGRIQSAVRSLIHRGPDQQGVYESSLISLGATRLKILDLHAGDQPITSSDGDFVIAFNGEIYNHAAVRSELEGLGYSFRTHTDTETVLTAFREWDTGCFAKLRGMFAVALWTESSRRLVLARDRLGIKPLYVSFRGDDLYFGSELKALFVHPEIDRYISPSGLDCFLTLNYVPSPWTLAQNIEKLSPGHWLEWRAGKVRSEAYWRLPFEAPRKRTLESAKEELDVLLGASIREHLLSDVPVGLWLSGGLDSSTVLHYASEVQPLRTFSISFSGRSFDEGKYIRQVASHYGTEHEQFDLNPQTDLPDAIDQFADYFDEPNADGGALPVWFLSKLTKQRVTVALSGEGADEILGGYLTYRADNLARIARRVPHFALRFARSASNLIPVSDDKISFEYKLKRFIAGTLLNPARAHVYWNGTFSDHEKRSLISGRLPGTVDRMLADVSRHGDRLGAYLWFDQKFFLPDDILMKVDRMSMAHSIEVRPPFLDHRLVDFAASLPSSFKVRGSKQKFLLKELMKDKLPAPITRRKKIGLDFPAHDWLRGPLRSLLFDTFAAAEADYSGFFNFDAIGDCLQNHLSRRVNLGYHLWGLMILFLWMKRWRIQTAAELDQTWAASEQILTSI
ncbi:MAG: asparagine synthase (glutamine-hydrolyzing) [Acidobacteriaceae bacterium]|nr:asparagine synthase (glutamine-hydrolyzing) [Acidobacteriaceae bacterium]